jgi:hypothetical protein
MYIFHCTNFHTVFKPSEGSTWRNRVLSFVTPSKVLTSSRKKEFPLRIYIYIYVYMYVYICMCIYIH